ncbi:MAG: hypothetical protein FWH23_07615 [Bacteroidales bacterium]|nr:hypothetical protein [Bacteroidales bacterium]
MSSRKTLFISAILLSSMLISNACGVLLPYSGGITPPVSNPFYQLADVQLVGCYGNRSAATVEFVFTVTAHSNLITSGVLGQRPNTKFVARGTAYEPYNSSGTKVELVRGYLSEVVIADIRNVPDYLVQFDRIEIQWYFNAEHHSGKTGQNLIFNSVPIVWR